MGGRVSTGVDGKVKTICILTIVIYCNLDRLYSSLLNRSGGGR
jgi:hypothetical protein